ncbi:hypothetical protein CDAR_53971 [Caerostris darwini]|uniref:Uncharacterized protein n=1 Tax=Caerostris darwini TaxID=1538125 RepID=A0AAV4WH16_9ARAC|nr:hypothetical protein CDAR_53971 [Caerostris darwini]
MQQNKNNWSTYPVVLRGEKKEEGLVAATKNFSSSSQEQQLESIEIFPEEYENVIKLQLGIGGEIAYFSSLSFFSCKQPRFVLRASHAVIMSLYMGDEMEGFVGFYFGLSKIRSCLLAGLDGD